VAVATIPVAMTSRFGSAAVVPVRRHDEEDGVLVAEIVMLLFLPEHNYEGWCTNMRLRSL
jgi:hypothetical protein